MSTNQTREDFNADYIVWLDTIKKGRFDDTNKMLNLQQNLTLEFHQNAEQWAQKLRMI